MGDSVKDEDPFVSLRGGRVVHFLKPRKGEIQIEDIAWHLARQCRYNGHLHVWYSNAEHSIYCADKATTLVGKKIALLHDAGEYVFGDLVRPVKQFCKDYETMLHAFDAEIYKTFLGAIPYDFDFKVMKMIDDRISATEMVMLRGLPQSYTNQAEPYNDVKFNCWDWFEAYQRYMGYFKVLFGGEDVK